MCGSGERERESLGTRDQRSRQAHFLDASAPDSLTCTSTLTHGTQRKAMVLPGYHFPEDENQWRDF